MGENISKANDLAALPPEMMARLERLDLAERARGEGIEAVAAFGELVFDVVPAAHHQQWLGEMLENKRVAIIAPPESAKTTWLDILIAWWIGKYPYSTNMKVSVTDSQAQNSAQLIADTIEQSERWKMVFPSVVPDKEKGWSREGYSVRDNADPHWAVKVANRRDPTLVAAGVGSSMVIGKRVTGILGCDDLHDEKSRTSDAIRQATISFFSPTVTSRVAEEARLVLVGTRWHPADLFTHIEATGLYKIFRHPALNTDGGSYWPEQWPMERLEEKRQELGSAAFALMYLNDAAAAQGRVLRAEWLVSYPEADIDSRWPMVYGVDFAIRQMELTGTRSRDPDYFAVAKMRIAPFGLILVGGLRGRFSQAEAEEQVVAHASSDNPKRIYIETNAGGQNFYQNLLIHTQLPITGLKATRNKGERIVGEMSRYFEFGRIRVSEAATPFLNAFRDEWVSFGDRSAHDDTLDAVYWAFRAGSYAVWEKPPAARGQGPAARGQPLGPMARIEQAYAR